MTNDIKIVMDTIMDLNRIQVGFNENVFTTMSYYMSIFTSRPIKESFIYYASGYLEKKEGICIFRRGGVSEGGKRYIIRDMNVFNTEETRTDKYNKFVVRSKKFAKEISKSKINPYRDELKYPNMLMLIKSIYQVYIENNEIINNKYELRHIIDEYLNLWRPDKKTVFDMLSEYIKNIDILNEVWKVTINEIKPIIKADISSVNEYEIVKIMREKQKSIKTLKKDNVFLDRQQFMDICSDIANTDYKYAVPYMDIVQKKLCRISDEVKIELVDRGDNTGNDRDEIPYSRAYTVSVIPEEYKEKIIKKLKEYKFEEVAENELIYPVYDNLGFYLNIIPKMNAQEGLYAYEAILGTKAYLEDLNVYARNTSIPKENITCIMEARKLKQILESGKVAELNDVRTTVIENKDI